MSKNDTFVRNNILLSRVVDGQLVILNLEEEKLYILNESARAVWNIFLKKKNLDEAIEQYANTFSIEIKIAQDDLTNVIKKYIDVLFYRVTD